MNEFILTYDLGTTGSKVAIFDNEYELKSSVYQEYKTYYGPNGQVEQNPEDWWHAICISTRKLLDGTKIAPDEIVCVSFTGQQTSLVPTNEEGKPSRKTAMIWMDSRAEKQAQLIRENLGWEKFYSITARGKILSSYPLTEIMWVRDNEPEVFGRTYKFMQVKDHIISRLTGEFVSDFSEASDTGIFDIRKREWSEEILEVAGIPKEMLPELHESSDVIGHVTKGASLELPLKVGTPVVVGGGIRPALWKVSELRKKNTAYMLALQYG